MIRGNDTQHGSVTYINIISIDIIGILIKVLSFENYSGVIIYKTESLSMNKKENPILNIMVTDSILTIQLYTERMHWL